MMRWTIWGIGGIEGYDARVKWLHQAHDAQATASPILAKEYRRFTAAV